MHVAGTVRYVVPIVQNKLEEPESAELFWGKDAVVPEGVVPAGRTTKKSGCVLQ